MNEILNNTDKNTKSHKGGLLYPELSYIIQGCFFETRKQCGPGQKENIYQICVDLCDVLLGELKGREDLVTFKILLQELQLQPRLRFG